MYEAKTSAAGSNFGQTPTPGSNKKITTAFGKPGGNRGK